MDFCYEVPQNKLIRVTDAACEADDPFAIAHALLCRKFDVKAIFAEQFGGPETTRQSYEEINIILNAMGMNVPALMGEEGKFSDAAERELSPAVKFLIQEALKEDDHPLFVLCLGALTNVAVAIREYPEIAKKMTVVWIGGQDLDAPNPDFREFNSGNDVDGANFVLSSGVDLWLIPVNVYGTMHIGLAEIQRKIYPCGKIGQHLFENMVSFNMSKYAGWTAGESWSLGDSPAVGVALDQNCGKYVYREAPIIKEDTTYRFEKGRAQIRVYTSINSRFILEDFFAKLEFVYGQSHYE